MRIFALLAATALAILASAAPVSADPDEPGTDDRPLTVRGISPLYAEPGDTLTVNGGVTNTTDGDLEGVRVRLRYTTLPFDNREQLEAHAEGERGTPSVFGPEWEADDAIPVDETVNYRLSIEVDDLFLGDFGVYPVALDAVDATGEQFAVVHTFLPHVPEDSEPEPTRIAWLWPLLDRPYRADDDTFISNELADEVSASGRLGSLLAGPPEDIPVTWVVDPGLLGDVRRLSSEGAQLLLEESETPGPAGRMLEPLEASISAQLWLDEARGILAEEHVATTPYAQADLVGLLAAELDGDAEAAVTDGRRAYAEALGEEPDLEAIRPAEGRVDAATSELLVRHGARTLILDDAVLPPSEELGHTPDAAAELPTPEDTEEPVAAMVADPGITGALDADTEEPADAAPALQRFVAETAMISAERPEEQAGLLAAPPSRWDPGQRFARDVLEASEDVPWLEAATVEELADDAGSLEEAGRRDARDEVSSSPVLEGAYLEDLREVRGDIRLFNTILSDDEDPFRTSVLRMESAGWRDREAEADDALDRLDSAVGEAAGQVRILPAEPITMASRTGEAPILVANDLPYAVSVTLAVHSDNSERLAVEDYTERMDIAPGGRTTVHVPLSATVNGRTVLNLSLHNEDGEPLDTESRTLPVTVTGLGSSALIVTGVAAGVLLVMLVPRAVRKWRRGRTTPALESDSTPTKEPGGDEHHER